MASYRSYGDTGAYRSRASVGIGSTFGRNTSSGSNLPSCRSSYSGVGSSSARAAAKERVLASFGGAFLKKDKLEEKPTFKYSCTKDTDKGRLYSGRPAPEDARAKSPLSGSKSSLYEKYSFSAGKTSERPSSVLDRYNRPASREKSREPEGISRYGSSTYPGSNFGRSYGNDGRIEKKDHPPPVSYRGLRPNSGRASREPSPEAAGAGKTNSFRVYSRAPSYGRSAASPSTSESSSATISTRFGSTAGSRFLPSRSGNERTPAVSYSGADRYRGSSGKSTNPKDEEESRQLATKSDEDGNYESPKKLSRIEGDKSDNRLADDDFVTLTIVTRGTSPTPPASSSYVRNRRAEIGIVHQKEVTRLREPPDTLNKETQCDRGEETSRFSRFSSSNRVSGAPSWSTYLDKYSSSGATPAGGSSVYSSRGFGNTSSSRLNSFTYRTNEATRHEFAAKESSTSSQETHSSGNRSQTEKVLSGMNCARPGNENSSASNEDARPSCGQDARGANKEASKDKVRSSEQCCYNARKTEINRSPGNSRTSSQDRAFQRKEDSTRQDCRESHGCYEDRNKDRQSPVSRCDECTNQRRPSIPRLGRSSPKSEMKVLKCSSKSDTASPKPEIYERRGSTPKSDVSSSSRTEESPRIVEGFCQDQNEEVVSRKHDASQRKDSASSGTSHSRSSASTPQSRSASTKNTSRQMTRTGSSDGSSSANMPIGKSKSLPASSVASQSVKIKATTPPSSSGKSTGSASSSPSVNLRQGGSPDARGKPPVPKNDTTTAATPKCIVAAKYVNKDFRKSTLNMENGDPSRSKYARRKKSQRINSADSQDSEATSEHVPRIGSSVSSTSIEPGRSRLRTPSAGSKPGMAGRCSNSNGPMRWEESRSGSKSPCGTTKRPSGTSSSSSSSRSTSANSSSSEDNDERVDRPGSRRRRRASEESPMRETRGKISAGSSRTSVLASSADEISVMSEKPPRPPSSPRSKSDRSVKTEEAKSFLMRALAPVTNFFKSKSQDSGDTSKSGGWVDSNDENYEVSNKSGQPLSSSRSIGHSLSKAPSFTNSEKSDGTRGNARIQRQSSGERPWWLDSNSDNVPSGVERASPWNDDVSQDTTISTVLPDDGKYKFKVWRQESEERGWWLDEVPSEETKKSPSSASSLSRRGSTRGSFRSADRRNRIRHQQSGERAWWMSDDPENVPEGVEVIPVASPDSQSADKPDGSVDNETLYSAKPLNKIRHIESGEKAWWMDSCSNVPDGVVRIPMETSNSTSDSSESYEKIDIGVNLEPQACVKRSLSRFPIEFPPPPPEEPLGDRASPEGVENPPDPPDNYGGRDSPYDNVQPTPRRLSPRKRPSTLPLFISQHTNIDDVLGDTAIPCHSPVLSRVRKQERVEEDSPEDSSECEEIEATQVIIHDSTPKTPMIQRRNRDKERIQPDGYIPPSFLDFDS
ncbi:PREDICTED: dentin sialophosphoprotein-like [Dinoponera quadriceps]|uniref:Dentin sialophosphoprotein-like n=1 Tax=Dinoponera quadriceps TaxID=609295 RepID=A0A6P3WXM1_DINQU|nr:PREDICTED: dentin sialophosphoprotein-like [Dinoponera quadriceps]